MELILTTGATGIRKRDCAPDVVMEVSERLLPGIPEAIRAYNIRYSKKAILDRSAAGIRNHTLMVNLPEGAKSAKESLEYILPELVHVVAVSYTHLIVTCASVHSRNRKAGYLIGQGRTMEEAMEEVKMVVEGVYSAKAAAKLAIEYDVPLPIVTQVNAVLFEGKNPAEAVDRCV